MYNVPPTIFQCNCVYIQPGNETNHILSHYTDHSEDKIWQYMRTFIGKHSAWVHQVACNILGCKKLLLEDYTNTVLTSGIPWDELALLIFARMYKIHIYFFMSGNKFWSTNLIRKRTDCCIM